MNDTTAKTELQSVDIVRILEMLPHRYPFLMIDRIEEIDGAQSGVGIKNVTFNEPHFQGHFPGNPVFPGVLMVEAMAQTAGGLVINERGTEKGGQVVFFMTIDKARFRRPVRPGDTLRLPVKLLRARSNVWKYKGEAWVGDKLVAEAEISAMVADAE
jgi:3-hydroxyacyl-[acyl-carrier-protein] dehydratase